MLTLYTTPLSANGRKPMALSRHLDLSIDMREVNVYRGEGQSPQYRSLHPLGKIPTLVDGDFVLWESNAILVYLAEHHGVPWSRDAIGRADILRWMFWESSHWQPVLTRILAPRVGQLLSHSGDPAIAIPWNDVELIALLRMLDSALERKPFVCTNEPSLADFAIAGMTTYFRAVAFPSADFPAIEAWLHRMESLPAWRATAVPPWAKVDP